MAYYAYKRVQRLIPQHIIDKQGKNYNGDPGYDGDLWDAAADYIEELEQKLKDSGKSMSKKLIEELLEYAGIAEATEKSHWAKSMREAAEYIAADLDKPLPEPFTYIFDVPLYAEPPASKQLIATKPKPLSDSDIAKHFHGPIMNLGTAVAFAKAVLAEASKEEN